LSTALNWCRAELLIHHTNVRPVPAPDRALATVLFTDIVSSTERAAALGDDTWTRTLDRAHTVPLVS